MTNTFRLISIYFILLILMSCTNTNTKKTEVISGETDDKYELIWSDEFNYSGLPDSTKWSYDIEGNESGWGNNEAQNYTYKDMDNAIVDNGILKIIAQKEKTLDKEYSSARLFSKADWQYGKIEVNARLPKAIGTWSAIWMMPENWSFNDNNWPDIGEIDIMEHVGHDEGIIHASAHSKDYQWQNQTQKTSTIKIPTSTSEFHSYILEWTAEEINVSVDDSLYFSYTNEGLGDSKWPYNKPFYLILNLAIGGAWGSLKGIDNCAFPQVMEIDYVRIYKKK